MAASARFTGHCRRASKSRGRRAARQSPLPRWKPARAGWGLGGDRVCSLQLALGMTARRWQLRLAAIGETLRADLFRGSVLLYHVDHALLPASLQPILVSPGNHHSLCSASRSCLDCQHLSRAPRQTTPYFFRPRQPSGAVAFAGGALHRHRLSSQLLCSRAFLPSACHCRSFAHLLSD